MGDSAPFLLLALWFQTGIQSVSGVVELNGVNIAHVNVPNGAKKMEINLQHSNLSQRCLGDKNP